MSIENQLRKARKAAGITQRALALKIGCSQSHLCNCERGRSVPSEQMIKRVQRVCASGGKGKSAKSKTTRKAARRGATSKRKAKRR